MMSELQDGNRWKPTITKTFVINSSSTLWKAMQNGRSPSLLLQSVFQDGAFDSFGTTWSINKEQNAGCSECVSGRKGHCQATLPARCALYTFSKLWQTSGQSQLEAGAQRSWMCGWALPIGGGRSPGQPRLHLQFKEDGIGGDGPPWEDM